MKIYAPAKVNLSLDIVGRREDGYHLMRMVMQTVSLYDVVYLARTPGGLRFSCDVPYLPADDRNLAVRAARAFFRHTGLAEDAELRLLKRIPSGAGMGGGSADAAAVLWGLNRLCGSVLSQPELLRLGESVGADVPFCLHGGTALVEGIGEEIRPLAPLPYCRLVVVKPRSSVNTKAAFAAFDRGEVAARPDTEAMLLALERGDLPRISREMENVFEQTAASGELEDIKRTLLADGALGAVMTGSGSAVFGIFDGRQAAARCRTRLAEGGRWVCVCEPVPHGPLIQPEL